MTDENQILATPFKTVAAGKNVDESIGNILNELKPYLPKIEKIVIGYPLKLSGEKSDMTLAVEKFKEKLETKLSIPICFLDERLTSKAAENSLKELNLSRKQRSKKSDITAALIILQNYLDLNKFN